MKLYINTSSAETELKLLNSKDTVVAKSIWTTSFNHSDELLNKIDNLLLDNHLTMSDISLIIVNNGPGSYTGLRVGVTTANLLAFSLDIPILSPRAPLSAGDKFSAPIMPYYERPPHITTPKK
jgi:tRNA threonylcarbamoyladenosine biosynthesis protein TsaB